MGLGGGGTSYITGYDALFINPANLQLREKNYTIQFSIGESGFYLDTPLSMKNSHERINTFEELLRTPQEGKYQLNDNDRESLLARNFSGNRSNQQFRSASTVNWLGIKWFRDERSYAFAIRTRQSNRYTVGRGYYDATAVETGPGELIDRSLTHSFQTLHEVSLGYSESFGFLSGLFPQISRFNIGIAPKIVISGPSFSTQYSETYSREEPDDPWVTETSYTHESTGIFSDYAERLVAGVNPFDQPGGVQQVTDLMNPTGIGAAIDFGITYLFTFGDDLSLIRRGDEPTEKSLRLSFSVSDLGILHNFDDPFRAETEESGPIFRDPGPISDTYFAGALLQDFQFLGTNGSHPLQNTESQKRSGYQSLLPASVQTGVLFQMNRIKMMGDFQLGLNENAFQSTRLISYIGAELRPLSFLPVRAGTRLSTDLPGYYSFGAGFETRYFDINAAVQFRNTASGLTFEPVAASAVAIKFYIP
ncbi:hypothetical protein BH23BAC3_BH23BAC3_10440 [soil metagenome]